MNNQAETGSSRSGGDAVPDEAVSSFGATMIDSCDTAQFAQPIRKTRDELIARSIADLEKQASQRSANFHADLEEARHLIQQVTIGSYLLHERETLVKLGGLVKNMIDGRDWFHQLWIQHSMIDDINNAS